MTSSWTSPDGKIRKEVSTEGRWGEKPYEWSECTLTISEYPLLGEFTNRTVVVGDSDGDLWRRLDICLTTMFVGEISKFYLDGSDEGIVIELHSLNFNGFIYEWDAKRKYDMSVHHKNKGKTLFEQKNHKDAAYRFTKALKIISSIPIDVEQVKRIQTVDGVDLIDIDTLKTNLYNNLSSCYFREQQWHVVLEMCQKVLTFDPDNVKALYKLGVAYEHDRNFEKAEAALSRALELEPGNKSCAQHLGAVRAQLKECNVKVNDIMKKMFIGAMEK